MPSGEGIREERGEWYSPLPMKHHSGEEPRERDGDCNDRQANERHAAAQREEVRRETRESAERTVRPDWDREEGR